jgi:hypothetical protein
MPSRQCRELNLTFRCQREVNQRPKPTATREPESGRNQRNRRLAETRRNHPRRNGKEGVQGSSP